MTVDFEFLASEAVTLLGTTKVKGALSTVPVAGFSTVGSCRIDVDMDSIRGTGIRTITLIVEDSPDGDVWSTVHSWTFTEPGVGSFEPSSLQDQVRVRFTTAGGLREATVGGVVVVPARDASESGGTPAGDDTQIQFNDNGAFGADPSFVWEPSGGNGILKLVTAPNGTASISGNGVGVQLQFDAGDGDATHVGGEVTITSGSSLGQDGGDIIITAGNDGGGGTGGDIDIVSGSSTGDDSWDGGDIAIRANPFAPAGNRGGDINVIAGTGMVHGGHVLIQGGSTDGNVQIYSGDGNQSAQLDNTGLHVNASVGFYGTAPIAQQTGVAVDPAAIHAALVALGLFTA